MSSRTCPNCDCSDLRQRDKITEKGDSSHAVHLAHHNYHRHPLATLVVGGVWLAIKLVDQICKDYECERCGHKFS